MSELFDLYYSEKQSKLKRLQMVGFDWKTGQPLWGELNWETGRDMVRYARDINGKTVAYTEATLKGEKPGGKYDDYKLVGEAYLL